MSRSGSSISTASGSFRTRFDRSRARGLSAFVGRDREMAALDAALERARSGSGQVVGVVAEAGTGKSRLCAEFVDELSRARDSDPRGTRRRAREGDPDAAHAGDVARLLRIEDGDAPETTRAKIAGRLLADGRELP